MPEPDAIAARVRRWDAEGALGPLTLELYPTLRCNLDCAFCDTTDRHRPPVNELPLSRHLEIVEEAAAMGVRRVFILGGGEPLMARQVTPALMHRVKALGMEGVLTTNGTILPPELVQQLLDDGWDELHVSIDGPSPEIHDALRGQAGAFRRTVSNLCRLRVARDRRGQDTPRLALHFVLTNQNHRTLPDMVRLAHALGAFRVDFDGLIAYRPEQQALALRPEQAAEVPEIAARALRDADELGIVTTLERFLDPAALRRGEALPEAPAAPEPRPGDGPLVADLRGAPCLKAWHYLVVQADGRTSPCCVLAGEGESVAERSLAEVWTEGAFLERVRAGMRAGAPLPRCRECSPNILGHERAIRERL
ncbi:MAG: radical SAM protein [Alphaproteobacteria bacterium]|nr:radical SAM protein [Alphaproteobacteria bacterium]